MTRLKKDMNFIEIGRYIIEQQKAGVDRGKIEKHLRDTFKWDDSQVYAATDPYFEEKMFASNAGKIKRSR